MPLSAFDGLAARYPRLRLLYVGPILDADEGERLRSAIAERPWARYVGTVAHAQMASLLAQSEVPGPVMTEVLRIYQATDGGTKKAVYDAIEEIVGSEPTEDQLLAAVRTLCPPKAGNTFTPQFDSARVGV